MYKLLIAIPTYETITTECFESLWASMASQEGVDIFFKSVKGYDCARARNEIVKDFLKDEKYYTHLLMVDSDTVLPTSLFVEDPVYLCYLFDKKIDVLLGWYPRKNDPGRTELFMEGYESYPAAARWNCSEISRWNQEFIPVKGGGFGCALLSRKVLEEIEYPYFKYESRDDGTFMSEDLYFCDKARDAGFQIWTSRSLGCDHVGKKLVKAFN